MPQNKLTLFKRYISTAKTYRAKGKRNWAYAKNDQGDEHYGIAKAAFAKAKENRDKAEQMLSKMDGEERAIAQQLLNEYDAGE